MVDGQNFVQQALYLGDPSLFNTTRDDCLWKRGSDRDTCPDKDIRLILYTSAPNSKRSVVSANMLLEFAHAEYAQFQLCTAHAMVWLWAVIRVSAHNSMKQMGECTQIEREMRTRRQ